MPLPAGARLAELLAAVIKPPEQPKKRSVKAGKRKKPAS